MSALMTYPAVACISEVDIVLTSRLHTSICAGPSAAALSSGAAAAPLPAAGSQRPVPSGPGRAGGPGGSSAQPCRQSGGATGRIRFCTWVWQVVTGPAAHSSEHSTGKRPVSRHVSSEHLNVVKACQEKDAAFHDAALCVARQQETCSSKCVAHGSVGRFTLEQRAFRTKAVADVVAGPMYRYRVKAPVWTSRSS